MLRMWISYSPLTCSFKSLNDWAAPNKWLDNCGLCIWCVQALWCNCLDLTAPTVPDVLNEVACWCFILHVKEPPGCVFADHSHAFEGVASTSINVLNPRNQLIKGIDRWLPVFAHLVIGLKFEYPWIIHFSLILYSNSINMINIEKPQTRIQSNTIRVKGVDYIFWLNWKLQCILLW